MVMYHKASKIVKPKMDYLKVTPTMLPLIFKNFRHLLLSLVVQPSSPAPCLPVLEAKPLATEDLKCAAGAGSQA